MVGSQGPGSLSCVSPTCMAPVGLGAQNRCDCADTLDLAIATSNRVLGPQLRSCMSSVSIHALGQANSSACKQGKSQPLPSPWHPARHHHFQLPQPTYRTHKHAENSYLRLLLPPRMSMGLSVSFLSTGKAKLYLITFHSRQVSSQHSLPPASGWWFRQQSLRSSL